MKQYYTIGEIYRNGLLLNHKKVPYTSKGTISRIVGRMKGVKEQKTPWGIGKLIPLDEIAKHNKKHDQWGKSCPNCGGDIGECECPFSDWYNSKSE
jgi:hypothetical protein